VGRMRFGVLVVAIEVGVIAGIGGQAQVHTPSQALVATAEAKMKSGDTAGALVDLAEAIKLDPRNGDAFGNRGLLRQHAQDLDGAIADFTQAIAVNPRHAVAYKARMSARLAKGDFDGTIADAHQVLALLPESVGAFDAQHTLLLVHFERAYRQPSATDRDKLEAALKGIDAANALLAWRPDFVDALVYKGIFLRIRASLEADAAAQNLLLQQAETLQARASELMERAKASTGESAPSAAPGPAPVASASPAGYLKSAEQKWDDGDIDGAIVDLGHAITLDPRNGEALFLRGFLNLVQGRLDDTLIDLTEVTVLNTNHAPSYAFRSVARLRKNDLTGALADARRAVELDSRMRLAHRVILTTYWDDASPVSRSTVSRRVEAAIAGNAAADAALKAIPNDGEVLIFKALFLQARASLETDLVTQAGLGGQATALRTLADDQIEAGAQGPVRAGGAIPVPRKLVDVPVSYPDIARTARVQGIVIMDVLVDARGRVAEATVVRSIPLLDRAALDAVRQWVFQPTIADGMPALVTFSVTVNFTLD
jgi:TonB family protein